MLEGRNAIEVEEDQENVLRKAIATDCANITKNFVKGARNAIKC